MEDIKYVSLTANGVVFTAPKHIIGWETTGDSRFSFYDEADDSQTAAQLCDTLRGTSYYKRAHNIFPLPGLKLNNGLYVTGGFDEGIVTVYYREDYNVSGSILYQPVSEANVSLSSADCELIGGDIWSGIISVYDGTAATAAQLVMTLRTGSYFFYGSTMFSQPVDCDNGLYIAGASGKGEIFYRVK